MPDRQKPFGVWIAAGLILLLVIYPLSVGPVICVITAFGGEAKLPPWCVAGLTAAYFPVAWIINNGPDWLSQSAILYVEWWVHLTGET